MNKLYTFALVVFAGLLFTSCETDSTSSSSADRMALVSGNQLRIINNSDFKMSGEVFCFGAEGNISVNSDILVMGNATVPPNTEITYKNFAQSSNSSYRINPWYVTINENTPIAYNSSSTNNFFGQLYNPGLGQSKFANWRYLKAEFSTTTIPGLVEPIEMHIEFPLYSNNNSGETIVNLTPYGINKNLHLSQSSIINSSGNTVLIIESELVDHMPMND